MTLRFGNCKWNETMTMRQEMFSNRDFTANMWHIISYLCHQSSMFKNLNVPKWMLCCTPIDLSLISIHNKSYLLPSLWQLHWRLSSQFPADQQLCRHTALNLHVSHCWLWIRLCWKASVLGAPSDPPLLSHYSQNIETNQNRQPFLVSLVLVACTPLRSSVPCKP